MGSLTPDLECLRDCEFVKLAARLDPNGVGRQSVNELMTECESTKNFVRHQYGAEVACGIAARAMLEQMGVAIDAA